LGAPSTQLGPGQDVQLELQWQALAEMDESYMIFLHLIDDTGKIVSQVDTLPQAGAAPTTSWLPGEIIEDELLLTIPTELAADSYQLIIGLYDPDSGKRLKVGSRDSLLLISIAQHQP
jgi:hypothetical protein